MQARFPSLGRSPVIICQKLTNLRQDLDSRKFIQKAFFAILSKLKNGKASGMSMIPNKILKSAKHIISESLTDIFNASLEFNTFPDDLKVAGETPIFKNGERND